ncbi:MAG: tetratricopeptide repeat protein, partial [Vicinamibacterales bacterium]
MAGVRSAPSHAVLAGAVVAAAALFAGCASKGITPVHTAFNKGVYFQSTGDTDAAIAEYRSALRENPDDYRARFNLAVAIEH